MKPIEWRVRMACAERGIWSASELQRLVYRRTGVRLSPQTLQAWFRDRPVRIEVRTLTAVLNALGCALTDVIRLDPPRTDEEARATRNEAAHYKQKDHAWPTKTTRGKKRSRRHRPEPDVGGMLAALAEGAEPVAAKHLQTHSRSVSPSATRKRKRS